MSLWVDKEYLNLLSVRLDRFKWKDNKVANARCPFCGDSQKNKYKARGYFYQMKGGYAYKCHNCGVGYNLGNVIKQLDPSLYKQYVLARFKDGEGSGPAHKPHADVEYKGKSPVFKKKSLIDSLMDRVDTLPEEDHMAVQLMKSRLIPEKNWSRLYHIDNVKNLEQLSEKYRNRITGTEPRLVIPFWDNQGKMFAVSCRSYETEAGLRYVTLRIDDNIPLIYGSETIDPKKRIYVVEGPLDSLFLDNCIAVSGSDFKKVRKFLPKSNTTFIPDNQPRNRDVLRQMRGTIDAGYSLFIWPSTVRGKDVNDYFLTGKTENDIMELIKHNTFTGAAGKMAVENWSRL